MRKIDYLILARALRLRVESYEPMPSVGMTLAEHQLRQSESLQAVDLAKYLAGHFAVNRVEFLKACGIRA